MTVVGVNQGLPRALAAEPLVAHARARLDEAGLGVDLWVCTHVVPAEQGNQVALGLCLTDPDRRTAAELAAAVLACFEAPADESSDDAGEPGGQSDDHSHQHGPLPPGRTAVVVGTELVGNPDLGPGAEQAAAAQASLETGRAVVYPGVDELRGTIAVAEVVARSAIDEVVSMGGPLGTDGLLRTRDHVRPLRQQGRWVLHVEPAAGGVQVPFESPVHQACCLDH